MALHKDFPKEYVKNFIYKYHILFILIVFTASSFIYHIIIGSIIGIILIFLSPVREKIIKFVFSLKDGKIDIDLEKNLPLDVQKELEKEGVKFIVDENAKGSFKHQMQIGGWSFPGSVVINAKAFEALTNLLFKNGIITMKDYTESIKNTLMNDKNFRVEIDNKKI